VIWYIDDDGSAMIRLRVAPSYFGPVQQGAGAQAIQLILEDMERSEIDVQTLGMFTRTKTAASESGASETVWKGRIMRLSQLSAAREHLQSLALSYAGE
jgi:hypothetical protein